MIVLLTGLSGSGKTTISKNVKIRLANAKLDVEIIDGDEYREVISRDLGFSKKDRIDNIRRLSFIASKFAARGSITILSIMCPYNEIRCELVAKYESLKIVHVDCPIDQLIERDTKGLYKRALLPPGHEDRINNLSGVNDVYDVPTDPDLYMNTYTTNLEGCITTLCFFIAEHYKQEKYGHMETIVEQLAKLE